MSSSHLNFSFCIIKTKQNHHHHASTPPPPDPHCPRSITVVLHLTIDMGWIAWLRKKYIYIFFQRWDGEDSWTRESCIVDTMAADALAMQEALYWPRSHRLFWPRTFKLNSFWSYYSDVIMGAMASQITSLAIVYSTVYSGADQRKHQSSGSLAFVRGIHRWIPRTKGQ